MQLCSCSGVDASGQPGGNAMESEKFDALIRRVHESASRRTMVGAGLGIAILSVAGVDLGLFESAEAKKHHKHKKKKPKKCSSSAPIKCGSGCCTSEYPTCCPDALTHDSLCLPADATCCPLSQGGSGCPAGTTCCPAGVAAPFGSCATSNEVCCDAAHGGGDCRTGTFCCPSAVNHFDSGGCCDTGSLCCNVSADCAALPGTVCDFGCCVV